MYSAILNGIVGVHIDKRVILARPDDSSSVRARGVPVGDNDKRVAIGTRSANHNPEFRRICRGVPIEARPYEYSISFPGDLIRDTAHAQHQFPMWEEISALNIEFGNE